MAFYTQIGFSMVSVPCFVMDVAVSVEHGVEKTIKDEGTCVDACIEGCSGSEYGGFEGGEGRLWRWMTRRGIYAWMMSWGRV